MLTAAVDPNAVADTRFETPSNDIAVFEAMFDSRFKTPLQMAVVRKATTIVELLLEAYADINVKSKDDWEKTCLAKVAADGDMDMVRFLVERGACVNASSPLAYAASEGHPDVVRYLLEAGAEKDCRSYENDTPLLEAVIESHYKVVDILLEAEADVNAGSGTYCRTPLMQATCSDLRMMIKLLDAAADVNRVDKTGETASSTRVNQRTVDGGTVLHIAAEENQLDVVQLLLTGRADLQIRTSTGETALDAARRCCSGEAEELLEISTCAARRPGSERKRKLQVHGDLR
eukprot:s3420_g7.t1